MSFTCHFAWKQKVDEFRSHKRESETEILLHSFASGFWLWPKSLNCSLTLLMTCFDFIFFLACCFLKSVPTAQVDYLTSFYFLHMKRD